MTDYTSVKIPKALVVKFDSKHESKLYRSFSEFVLESIRLRLSDLSKESNGDQD